MTRRVRVEPGDIELEADDGETVMAAAQRAGFRWPTVCGGQAECGACAMEVVDDAGGLDDPNDDETFRLAALPERRLYPDRHYRLACQTRAVDGLVVRKRGVTRAPGRFGVTFRQPTGGF